MPSNMYILHNVDCLLNRPLLPSKIPLLYKALEFVLNNVDSDTPLRHCWMDAIHSSDWSLGQEISLCQH